MRVQHGLLPTSLALTLVLLSGCPGDDGTPMETEGETESEGTTGDPTATSTPPPSTTDPDPSTSSGATTETVDDTTMGPEEESSSGEPPPTNVCVGFDQVGDIGTVFSRDGLPIDTTCDATPMPCGGDVLGMWAVEESCGYEAIPNPLEQDCPGSTFEVETLSHNGTMDFADDGTFVQTLDIQNQAVFTLDPMACFGVSCMDFNDLIQMDDPMASCMDDMGMCRCTFPPEMGGMAIMGNYEVMGDILTLEVGGEVEEFPFCITGDRLDTWNPLFNTTVTEELCNDEQDCVDALGDTHQAYVCVEPEAG